MVFWTRREESNERPEDWKDVEENSLGDVPPGINRKEEESPCLAVTSQD